jgi:hypothetical protein
VTRWGSRKEHDGGYIRMGFGVCCSFFLFSFHNVLSNNSHYYLRLRDFTALLLGSNTNTHITLVLHVTVAFSLELLYYVELLISEDSRECTCWSCGIHHGRSSLRLHCVVIHTTNTDTHTPTHKNHHVRIQHSTIP